MSEKNSIEGGMYAERVSARYEDPEHPDAVLNAELPVTVENPKEAGQQTGFQFGGADRRRSRAVAQIFSQIRQAVEPAVAREKKIANYAFWTSLIGNWVSAIFFNTVLSPIFLFIAGAAWGYKSGLSSQNESLFIGAKKAAFDGAQLVIFNLILGLIFSVGIGFSIPAIVGLFIALGALPYFLGWMAGRARGNHLSKVGK